MSKISFILFFTLVFLDARESKVEVAIVTQALLENTVHFNGSVRFHQQSRIASQSTGVVTKLYFKETDFVKKGTLLLEIDSLVLQAELASLQSQSQELKLKLDLATTEFKRSEKLFKAKGVSKQSYEKFRYTKLQSAQAYEAIKQKLKASKVLLEKKRLYAPFDGVIASRDVEKGEWLSLGTNVGLLVNTRDVDLYFYLPQKYISAIKKDTFYTVSINQRKYQAKVLGSLLNGDASTRTFALLLRLQHSNDEMFFQGMQADLNLVDSSKTAKLMVPRDAIVQKYDSSFIYVVKEGKAQALSVKVLSYDKDMVAVSSKDLKKGMQVIVKGNERLYPNAEVKISD